MTRLRVLSGRHAGVFLDWHSTRLMVGASEELDVFIGDWNMQPIELQRGSDGRLQARWHAAADSLSVPGEERDGDDCVRVLEPWIPVRFGAVILCIGPAADAWPDDAELLARCFAPAPAVSGLPDPARKRGRSAGRRVMTAALACSAVAAMPSSMPDGTRTMKVEADASGPSARTTGVASGSVVRVPALEPLARLRALPGASALAGLDLVQEDGRIVAIGVLPARAAVDSANHVLDAVESEVVVSRRFAAVPDIVDRLNEALGGHGLRARHLQGRSFEVSGRVADPGKLSTAVAQVTQDVAAFGAQVATDLRPMNDGVGPMSALLIDSHGTAILRTRDGVKHIVPAASATVAPSSGPRTVTMPAAPLRSPNDVGATDGTGVSR